MKPASPHTGKPREQPALPGRHRAYTGLRAAPRLLSPWFKTLVHLNINHPAGSRRAFICREYTKPQSSTKRNV